jgi:hypothetical protein
MPGFAAEANVLPAVRNDRAGLDLRIGGMHSDNMLRSLDRRHFIDRLAYHYDQDASVVAISERLGIVTVATVNLRDFATVRPRHIPAFITVPRLMYVS